MHNKSMTANQAIESAGSVSQLAKILGVKRQAVQNYRRQGLPPKRVLQLMQIRPEWFKKAKT
jgi:predicted transcriptional regulator